MRLNAEQNEFLHKPAKKKVAEFLLIQLYRLFPDVLRYGRVKDCSNYASKDSM